MIKLEVDPSADAESSTTIISSTAPIEYLNLGDLPVKERSTVGQLKELLVAKWSSLVDGRSGFPAPASAHHLRVRDGKVSSVLNKLRLMMTIC